MWITMAWIESDQDLIKVIWIDGYLPSVEDLENLRRSYRDSYKSDVLIKRPNSDYSPDELFKRLGSAIRKKYCNKEFNVLKLFHSCNLFLTRYVPDESDSKNMSIVQPDFKLGDTFRTELLKASRNPSYRQVLITFSPYICEMGDKCTRELIEKVNFRIRGAEDYEKFDDFRRECENFLEEYFSIPFLAPCMIARNRLNSAGFSEPVDDDF